MAQNLKQDILDNKPYVDIILGPDSYRKLPMIIKRSYTDKKSIVDTKLSRFEVYEGLSKKKGQGKCLDFNNEGVVINFVPFVLCLLLGVGKK